MTFTCQRSVKGKHISEIQGRFHDGHTSADSVSAHRRATMKNTSLLCTTRTLGVFTSK